ncbi:MAG: GAF domain-containing protein [bacterium]|nr:GAF domain-containing protein [bacterium]
MAERAPELRRQLRRVLDALLEGDPPSAELELILLRADHVLRTQDDAVQEMRQSLLEQVDDLQLRLDHLSVLREVGELLSANLEGDALLDRLPAMLREAFGAESASLWLLDPGHERLEIVAADPTRPGPDERTLPLDRGVAGWVARQGRSRLVPDTDLDPVFLPHPRNGDGEGGAPRTLLCAPLKLGDRVLGVVHLSHREPGRLDESDEALLELACPSIALAVSRTRLHEGFRQRLEDQTRELQDVREFFRSIVNSSDDLIVVLSPDQEMILVSTVAESLLGLPVDELLNRPAEGRLLDAAAVAELSTLTERGDSLRDQDVLLRRADGREIHASLNASPIRGASGELLGSLCIFRIIERRMRSHHELTRLNQRLNALFEAAVDLGSSLDLGQVLERCLAWIRRLTEADEASLLLLSPDGRHLARLRRDQEDQAPPLPVGECPEGIVVRQQKPLLLSEPVSVRQFLPEDAGHVQSCIMVPLKILDNVLGVLRVDSHSPARLFTHQDLRMCTTFASQAAMAIDNSRLYAATRRESSRLRGLLDLSRRIRDLRNGQAILAQFAQTALDLEGVQAVVAWEYRKNEHQLRRACALAKGLTLEPGESLLPAGMPGDDPLPYLLANRERRLRFRPLPEQLPPWAPAVRDRERAISLLAVPVVDGGEVYGLMLFYGDEALASLEDEESFISVLALQAAAAIHSQRLLQENQAAREFLTSVVSSATDAIVVTDRLGRITLFNPGAEAMLGLSAREMVGLHAPGLYPDATRVLTDLRRALRRGQDHLTVETTLHARERDVPVQLSLSWMRDARNRIMGVLGVAKDISELKKLEQARLEAERLSGIERMAVTVSDRINTPLSVVLAQVELVRFLQPALGPEALAALQSIEDQVGAIQGILDQLNHLKDPRIKDYALPNVHMYDLEAGGGKAGAVPPGGKDPTREGSGGAAAVRRRGKSSTPS